MDGHFATITWLEDTDQAEFHAYVELEGNFWETFPRRFKMAWKVLWRRHVDTNVGVILTQDQVREMADHLMRFANSSQ